MYIGVKGLNRMKKTLLTLLTVFLFLLILSGCDNVFHDDIENTPGSGNSNSDISSPSFVSVSKGASTSLISISWASVSNIEYYEVWRSTSSSGNYVLIKTAYGTSTSDTSATACITYYYKIIAVNGNGQKSPMSDYDYGYRESSTDDCSGGGSSGGGSTGSSIPPPSSIQATDGMYNTVILIEWSTVSNAVRYSIYRSESLSGSYTWIGEEDTSQLVHSDWSVEECKFYYYKIKSIDSSGNVSEFSSADRGYGEKFGEGTCGF